MRNAFLFIFSSKMKTVSALLIVSLVLLVTNLAEVAGQAPCVVLANQIQSACDKGCEVICKGLLKTVQKCQVNCIFYQNYFQNTVYIK